MPHLSFLELLTGEYASASVRHSHASNKPERNLLPLRCEDSMKWKSVGYPYTFKTPGEFMDVHWNIHSVAMVIWHAAQGNYAELRSRPSTNRKDLDLRPSAHDQVESLNRDTHMANATFTHCAVKFR